MSDRDPLAVVLDEIADEALVLAANGASFSVARVEKLIADARAAAEPWLLWLSEGDALMQCGYAVGWLRARFPGWEREGHARMAGKARQYRAAVIPRRANISMAEQRGREAAAAVRDDRKSA